MSIRIICHMISSVDGRLLPARWNKPAVEADVTDVYESAASSFGADGWIVGRATMAEYADCVHEGAPAELRGGNEPAPEPYAGRRGGRPLAVFIDPKGKLLSDDAVLPTGEHLVAVLSPHVAENHLAKLRAAGVSYVFEGPEGRELEGALAALERLFGVDTLLLEGGGIINGAFFKAGLVNALSVLVYPAVDGLAGVPSIVGLPGAPGEKPAEHAHLALAGCEVLRGGIVWLTYSIAND